MSKLSTRQMYIPVEAVNLNKNIKKTIFNIIYKKKNTCTEKDGYILDIKNDIKILDNSISRATSEIIFEVEYNIVNIIPKPGFKLKCKVCLIFDYGILLKYTDKIKIFIPSNYLKNYVYENNNFIKIKDDDKDESNDIIKKENMLYVELLDVKYENNEYSCIGKISKDI